ncbi:Uncharacterized protein PRO82_001968 [Candidatus Protochlamydia amoebophila]|uniref:hypothetical protein n=1 Tax=Candidatus Protochlamydia amoebophila TaxID=362787 RepID=UPI001BC9A3A6|nr:hypothetical protein [Candidatus Protochlamydia amoebophila]MBS4164637.1 Uncharacterized protein [Candidatus Protochlamydia amoebophila]
MYSVDGHQPPSSSLYPPLYRDYSYNPESEFGQQQNQWHSYYSQQPSAPPIPSLTNTMHTATTQLFSKIREVANSVFPTTAEQTQQTAFYPSPISPAPVFVDLSHREYSFFSNRTEHHYHPVEKTAEEKENNKQVWAVVLGLVVGGISTYLFGKMRGEYEAAEASNTELNQLEAQWKTNKNVYTYQYQGTDYVNAVDKIISKTHVILDHQKTNRLHKQMLIITFLAAGALGIAGGLVASNALMGAGLVAALGASFFGLYKFGYYYSSKLEANMGREIKEDLNSLSKYQFVVD